MNQTKKTQNAWCMYDWANSAYLLVISSTLFPIYFNGATRSAFDSETVRFFGVEVINSVLYSYAVSVAFLIVAFISPWLSGMADYGGKKKFFLRLFTYIGSVSTAGLFWFRGENVEYGVICSVLAGIGYSGSLVFYNSYLPEISSASEYDKLSAKGYAYGYIGSVLLLLVSFALVQFHVPLGLSAKSDAVRISFLLVGIWWFGFAQYSFYYLPDNKDRKKKDESLFWKGVKELKIVFHSLKELKMMKVYLLAFFFYSAGVQTVMHLAAIFGEKELRLEASKLIITITIIQIVAIAGAYLFAALSKKFSNGISILIMLMIWIGICGYAYVLQTEFQFYGLAVVVGLVMGGIQSMSRSTFSKLIPKETIDNTSYFSFYDVVEKLSIVVGTFSFGFIEHLTGSMRNSTIALMLFFVVSVGLLLYSKVHRISQTSCA
ncbi:MFS transporter [Reichenbachiella carrageenanivorans]|uniref:MFS transporter n=1 Tax=Reichenbachiella carrageenanivorans TaxID=2979869 RepID=A0ABY6CY91_9BACT|nr:MFS transporter [Reichenbachiella carrageenanivorans]UXX78884.1 MFS transporter [Reichenbachiella carrageenanivorans]